MKRRIALSAALLLSAALVYGGARDRAFVAGPYLADPGAHRVAVRGFTRAATRWSVVPRTSGVARVDESAPSTRHDLELANLPENATIEADVLEDGRPIAGGFLRFRSDPGTSASPFVFAVVGDSGGAPDRILEMFGQTPAYGAKNRPDRVAHQMSAVRPQLVLHAGDVVYPNGSRDDYARAFFRPFESVIAVAPIAAAAGNHDFKSEGGAPFLEVFGPRRVPPGGVGFYGSFEFGPLHVAVLDSNIESFDQLDAQARWLEKDLQSATRPWKIALAHVPLHFHSAAQRAAVGETQRTISDTLWKRCVEGGVTVAFCGHCHWYERSPVLDGVTQIISGGGGRSIQEFEPGDAVKAEGMFHFVQARVEGDAMLLRAIDWEGREIEKAPVKIERRR